MDNWITVKEAQSLSGYNGEHIRRLARTGKITGKKWGESAWMIEVSSLMEYLDSNRIDARRGPKSKSPK